MKVGIISINMYSKGLNFACPLHTYAFQQFLLKNGIDNTVLNYTPVYYDNFNLRNPYDYYTKKCNILTRRLEEGVEASELEAAEKKLAWYTKKRDTWKQMIPIREARYDKFQHFIDTKYIKTETCYNAELLEVMDPGFDCYICATDVIWKKQPDVGYDRGFFLGSRCMDNKWKISYSASRGVYYATCKEEDDQFFHFLEDINYISVREPSLKNYIEQNTNLKATIVLDPVLLHEPDFYDDILVKPEEEHYVLLYYVMEKAKDTRRAAVRFARAHHLKIVEITDLPFPEGRLTKVTDVEHIYRYDIGVEEWLGYLRYADYIFTNSFHACCFSILFERQFFAGFRHGDKVANVLETFGLSKRQISPDSDLTSQLPEDIDYGPVRTILAQKRAQSSDFILSALRDIQTRQRPQYDYGKTRKELTYPISYDSQIGRNISWTYKDECVKQKKNGSWEFQPTDSRLKNDGTNRLLKNEFLSKSRHFLGWRIRVLIDKHFFWYQKDGSLSLADTYGRRPDTQIRLFKEEEEIPYLPLNQISMVVAEAVWSQNLHDKFAAWTYDRIIPSFKDYVKRHDRLYDWISRHVSGRVLDNIKKI